MVRKKLSIQQRPGAATGHRRTLKAFGRHTPGTFCPDITGMVIVSV